jgi:SAM-dependent methyltransferase
MLHPDIVQLKQFYNSRLGDAVANFIGEAILRVWPKAENEAMLVLGYGTPYVRHYLPHATPLIIAMPAQQGAGTWPPGENNRVLLTHDSELPLQNNSISRVLLVHSIEHSENLSGMMEEIWRVLVPGGKVLAVTPNRVSLWSGSGNSPFGTGRPFNVLQLRALFARHSFTVTTSRSALFTPPFLARISRKVSYKIEKLGQLFWWFLGGVLIMEAEKQPYASITEPVFHKMPRRMLVGATTARISQKK